MNRERLRQPPSTITGELYRYLEDICRALNGIPNISYFSGTHPNSGLTGLAGNVAINISPASNVSRVFVKYSSALIPDKSSWNTVA